MREIHNLDNEPLVSVIIPVYNVENYVEKCVHSVLQQTYSNLEILLINDGSTDSSGEICKGLAQEDSRIEFITKKNGGPGGARNVGLSHAHGDWVAFIDSDDFISPLFIEVLLSAALTHGVSVATTPFGTPFPENAQSIELANDREAIPDPFLISEHEAQKELLYQHLDTAAQWRIYRRDLLGENPFPDKLYYEDLGTTYRILHGIGTLAVVNTCSMYAYRMRSNSIIRQTYKHVKGASALLIGERLYRDINQWYPDLKNAVSSRVFSLSRMVFAQIPPRKDASEQEVEDAQNLWSVLRENRRVVLKDSYARKRERLAAAIACVGENPFYWFCTLCRKFGKMQ